MDVLWLNRHPRVDFDDGEQMNEVLEGRTE
jgi:hypothetical protein